MRCPNCNKFAAIDAESEPEEESLVVSPDEGKNAVVEANYRITLNCADCSTELKEARFELTNLHVEVDHGKDCDDVVQPEFDVSADVSRTEEFVPPKAKRQKRFFGIEGTVFVTCQTCGAQGSADFRDSVQSSHMEEIA